MIAAAPIAALPQPLPSDHLFLFIAGPGAGSLGRRSEALAIALPGRGWITIDCCKVGTELPQERIITHWRRVPDEPVVASVLTHPHDDHAAGLAELLDVPKPRSVAITGNPPPAKNLVDAVKDAKNSGVTSRDIAARTAHAAIAGIENLVGSGVSTLRYLRDGELLVDGPARVGCIAPSGDEIEELLGHLPRERANELSAVLEVTWGATRLLLGADLPWLRGRAVVDSGWKSVADRHPGLAAHGGLKIPHHGSREALLPDLLGAAQATPRFWVCAPYELQDLPRFDPGDGVDRMLAAEPLLHLTKQPHARGPAPQPILAVGTLRSTVPAAGPRPIAPRPPAQALDALWCFAFDAAGTLTGRWRDPSAIEVVP